ncbi:type-F conjugative transfer system pilin assembly thiol-disulfide isomerase TrbB [Serratia odorifera]|uniref:Type-F conjugative transfer system pilin assembly thiol-disulfide isomerase TrbB n=2 Tax=Serratia odorifera TaxID=618 RepID=D4EA34_SEROD|nr:type-F conjugative transfer system pilin assembly thiol-disulfide isomerase TrbB [Serratia odorifera]EFE93302.1 type-F conjugative transfer system pilin assembly thiol-disulfide isomerase TrbB [Serratia odorifera DSM 4582]VDZ51133.1 conjugal transfer protein TrbB [Serratia odorifera]
MQRHLNVVLNAALLVALSMSGVTVAMAASSTRDEIARLQQHAPQHSAGEKDSGATPAAPARIMTLSNGTRVNLADWTVVLFMQGHCSFCQKFDPLIKAMSAQHGFPLFVYTFDGQGDQTFPEAIPAPPDVMRTFFPGLPVASPTTFLVNVHTLATYPIIQGAADEAAFMARLDTVLQDATQKGVTP